LFGIYDYKVHIGNVTLYMIDDMQKSLRIGITIGREGYSRRGYGVKALQMVVWYVFDFMEFVRIEVGIYKKNTPSRKLFRKLGFELQTVLPCRVVLNGRYIDLHLYQLVKEKYEKNQKINKVTPLLETSIDY